MLCAAFAVGGKVLKYSLFSLIARLFLLRHTSSIRNPQCCNGLTEEVATSEKERVADFGKGTSAVFFFHIYLLGKL